MKDLEESLDPPREKVLVAAQKLFCRYGIQGTGIARVLSEAGVSRKTLYERFSSKDALVREVLQREGNEWRTWYIDGVHKLQGTPKQKLVSMFDLLEEWFASNEFYGCAFINAIAEHDKLSPPVAEIVDEHRRLSEKILEPIARAANADHPALLVRELGLIIDGAIVTAMLERSPRSADLARNLASLVVEARCR